MSSSELQPSPPRAGVIWLVNHPANLPAAVAQPPEVLLVTSSWSIHASLQQAGRQAVLLHQWYDDQAKSEAQALMQAITRQWHRFEGEDFTCIDGQSLGVIFEFYLANCMSYGIDPVVATWGTGAFILAMIQYDQLVEHHPAMEIHHDWPPSAAAEALAIFCQARNIACHRLPTPGDPQSLSLLRPASHASLKHRLMTRAYPYTSLARRLGQRLQLSKQSQSRATPLRRVATLHYPSLDGLSGSLALQGITLIPAMPWFLAPRPWSLRHARARADHQQLQSRWQAIRQNPAYRKRFHIRQIDCSGFFIPQFDALVNDNFRSAAWQLRHAKHFLESQRIDALLLPFDGPYQARILISAARRLGIPSIVVQHGMMALAPEHCDHPELTFADHVLAVSQTDADDLARRQPPIHARVAGSMQIDQISPLPRVEHPSAPLQVLVLCLCPSSLYDTSTDSGDFMKLVVDALNPCASKLSATFKLHPGDSLMRYERMMPQLAPAFPWTMHIRGSLQAMIAQADVVISCVSTGVGEALAMGRPVLFIPPTHRIIPTGFLPDRNGLPTARTAQELSALLQPFVDDPAEYVRQYDFQTHLQYYRPGGASPAQRLIEHLNDILTAHRP